MSEEDLELLITLDDPGDAQEQDTFNHLQAENTVAYWPGQPFSARGDTTIEQKPLLIMTLQGGFWSGRLGTCTLARFTGTTNDSTKAGSFAFRAPASFLKSWTIQPGVSHSEGLKTSRSEVPHGPAGKQ